MRAANARVDCASVSWGGSSGAPGALLTRAEWGELAAGPSPALQEVVAAYEATVQAPSTALAALDRQLTQRRPRARIGGWTVYPHSRDPLTRHPS